MRLKSLALIGSGIAVVGGLVIRKLSEKEKEYQRRFKESLDHMHDAEVSKRHAQLEADETRRQNKKLQDDLDAAQEALDKSRPPRGWSGENDLDIPPPIKKSRPFDIDMGNDSGDENDED